MSDTGIFDNRATMRRVFCVDGREVASVTANLIAQGPHRIRGAHMLYISGLANGLRWGHYPEMSVEGEEGNREG